MNTPTVKVTLLGTGTPTPRIERFGPSTLVEAGDDKLLFDCGRGAAQRLWQLGIPLREITALFLTHLHHDHTVGIPDLWLTGWLPPPYGRRQTPFRIFGPLGTMEMMGHLERAFEANTRIRMKDEELPLQGVAVQGEDITGGPVYSQNGVGVTAFEVDHGPYVKPAFGYRIEYKERIVVISGDTRFCENLIQFSKGADLLIHEVAMASEELLNKSEAMRKIIAHHTTPLEAAVVFERVKPRLAVFTHLVMLSESAAGGIQPKDLMEVARRRYAGPLEVGEDLMCIEVAKDTIVCRHPPTRTDLTTEPGR